MKEVKKLTKSKKNNFNKWEVFKMKLFDLLPVHKKLSPVQKLISAQIHMTWLNKILLR